jgi:hypothetical protein
MVAVVVVVLSNSLDLEWVGKKLFVQVVAMVEVLIVRFEELVDFVVGHFRR